MATASDIDALFKLYLDAYAQKDTAAVAELFEEDGALFSPFGPPAFGRAAIAATHADWFNEDETEKAMKVVEAREDTTGGHALVGFASSFKSENEPPQRHYGMSLNTLTRAANGTWRIRHCCLSMFDTPPDGFPT
ncbi:YybH family protein [Pseudoruegeria sp. SHC-113]|uniref:YybH family protein n=1 Tax=Pseudoruegeria sp. SHC-113 TaxID=2855439 RepID=UPI0021BB71AA|nr:SgcJ/EcaC family oxidoreductase [Pseudoruegeria sp. SHC-113]MCT8159880.1 SgcJ/EcaC family oxidoreductase [Pseudoruegeria sp. SHC-113]